MAPTICCQMPRGRETPRRLPSFLPTAQHPGDAHERDEDDGPSACQPVENVAGTSAQLRKAALARRKRTRGCHAATWLQRRAACDFISGVDPTAAVCAASEERWCTVDAEGLGWGLSGPKGLLGITVRTVELMRRNQLLQRRLSLLQEETRAFVQSVLSNPENRREDQATDGRHQDPAVSGSC